MRSLPERLTAAVRAARQSPAWAAHLGPQDQPFGSPEEFARRVPPCRRSDLAGQPWRARLRPGQPVEGILSSSGTGGGPLAFRAWGAPEARTSSAALAGAFQHLFGLPDDAVILNVLPGGVALSVPGVPVVAAGSRPGFGARWLAELATSFGAVVVVGEPPLVKRLLELVEPRLLADAVVHLGLGGQALPEALRDHLAALLGVPAPGGPRGRILSSLGVGELGLNLAVETPALVRQRQALRTAEGRGAAGLPGLGAPPLLLQPSDDWYVESVDGSLAWTALDPERLQPAIRYVPGDRGGVRPDGSIWFAGRFDEDPELARCREVVHGLGGGSRDGLVRSVTGALRWQPGQLHVQLNPTADPSAVRGALESALADLQVTAVPFAEWRWADWTPYEGKFPAAGEP